MCSVPKYASYTHIDIENIQKLIEVINWTAEVKLIQHCIDTFKSMQMHSSAILLSKQLGKK